MAAAQEDSLIPKDGIYIRDPSTSSISVGLMSKWRSRGHSGCSRWLSYATMSHWRLRAVDADIYGRYLPSIDTDAVCVKPFGARFTVESKYQAISVARKPTYH